MSISFAEAVAPDRTIPLERAWALLRAEPVRREADGTWVVSGYPEVRQLVADPRMSVARAHAGPDGPDRTLLGLDAPDHDWMRRHLMRSFGPPWRPRTVVDLERPVRELTGRILDGLADRTRMDVVADFTHPVPVAAICAVLGLPEEDHGRFAEWMTPISTARGSAETIRAFATSKDLMSDYLRAALVDRRARPRDDMITGVATDAGDGRAPDVEQLVENLFLLFLGGHETTVNAVASAILLLMRHPDTLDRLRADPSLVPAAFEEVLRLEPPAQFFDDRHALADTPVGDVTIPEGAAVNLVLAAANRDPRRFADPDTFDIDRPDNQHLSFLGGPHHCFGAPMARLEARIMIGEWVRRVRRPRLVTDPPPYRPNPALRGPQSLLVDHDGIDA